MHIGVFSYYYLPIINGVTITISNWRKLGEKAGHRFTIYIPQPGDKQKLDSAVVPYPAVSLYKRFGITLPLFAEQFVRSEMRQTRPDILHVHHPYFIGKLALIMKKLFGTPIVFTYHTRYADYARAYFPFLSRFVIRRLVTRMIVRFMNQCSAITVANASLQVELRRSGVKTPIFIVPPGIDTKTLALGNRAATRKRLGFRSSDFVLLYVGRLAKEKNIFFLLRAFIHIIKINPHVRMFLCGSGLETERIRSFAKRHRLEQKIIVGIDETPKTIRDIYAAADMFVYASQTETYGRVLVESMAAGLPVVALRGPSVVDIVEDGINGRVVWRSSPKVFAGVVTKLLGDRMYMKNLGSRAQQSARARFDSVASWKALSVVYESVLKSKSNPEQGK